MTLYPDGDKHVDIKCDSCGEERTVEQVNGEPCTDQLRKGWYVDNSISQGQGFHLCPQCRYSGATVQFLQWEMRPSKMGVDIIGALKSTVRITFNIEQYLGDLKAQIMTDNRDGISETMKNIINLLEMARANDQVAITELKEFGK